jgi:hypothetical protein
MNRSEEALVTLLSGKTPEAMYDALHAQRCLSERALRYPGEFLELIKCFLRSSRQRPLLPPMQIERLGLKQAKFPGPTMLQNEYRSERTSTSLL